MDSLNLGPGVSRIPVRRLRCHVRTQDSGCNGLKPLKLEAAQYYSYLKSILRPRDVVHVAPQNFGVEVRVVVVVGTLPNLNAQEIMNKNNFSLTRVRRNNYKKPDIRDTQIL